MNMSTRGPYLQHSIALPDGLLLPEHHSSASADQKARALTSPKEGKTTNLITMRSIFFTFVFLLLTVSALQAKMLSVSSDKLNLRSGPGTKYQVLWEYGRGVPLMVQSSKGNWYKVKDFENDLGWVHKSMVDRTPHMIVKQKRVNIRSRPSSKSKLVGKAVYGVVFKTLEQKSGWAKIKHESGLQGWIRRDLLWGW